MPLLIQRFKPAPEVQPIYAGNSSQEITTEHPLVKKQLELILAATVGSRWQTVQKMAYTLGGLGDTELIDVVTACIHQNQAFAGQEGKYIKCANKCFVDGISRPLTK